MTRFAWPARLLSHLSPLSIDRRRHYISLTPLSDYTLADTAFAIERQILPFG